MASCIESPRGNASQLSLIGCIWGGFAAHRRQAGSHLSCAAVVDTAEPVGAGLPAMGP